MKKNHITLIKDFLKDTWIQRLVIIGMCVVVYMGLALVSFDPTRQPVFGVTFSRQYAESLGVDWKANYLALLNEMGVRYIRIPTYWSEVEPIQGVYDFEAIDWMLDEAHKRNVKVTMVLGMRQPRWPECHFPAWTETLPEQLLNLKIKQLLVETVVRYKDHPALEYWQVENEPLLEVFGECPPANRTLVKEEIDLVRALDDREIVITASGELSLWYPEALWGDMLGSTLYRTTWSKYLAKIPGYDGYWSYFFLPPSVYRVKAFILGVDLDKFWIAELQAEPWFFDDPLETPLSEQYKSMSPQKLRENVQYALRVNPARVYLWGAEWWYYAREVLGVDAIWNEAQNIRW